MTWQEVPLWTLFRRREERGREDLPLLSVYRDFGVVPREGREDNHNRPGQDLSAYKRVRPGDLVLNKMKTWQGSIAISDYEGIVSPAYFVAEPTHECDQRFLHHLLRSDRMISLYAGHSKGIRPSQWDLPWEAFRRLVVSLPSLDEQRRIAHFLDFETERISELAEIKAQMIRLLEERLRSVRHQWWAELAETYPAVPLRRLGVLVEQGWGPPCDSVPAGDGEWGILKTSSVTSGVFDPGENKKLPDDVTPDPKWTVHAGDLLMVRGSGSRSAVGAVAIADPGNLMLTLTDLLYRLRGLPGDPRFYAEALRSPQVREAIEGAFRTDSGQTFKLRSGDIRDLPVPAVPTAAMPDAVAAIRCAAERTEALASVLRQQIVCLEERRRSLITAAVTGEMEVA